LGGWRWFGWDCRLGYEVIEMNASDCRSKKTLQQQVATLLGNTTINQFWGKTEQGKRPKQVSVHCVV
jgi:hypothetical protein